MIPHICQCIEFATDLVNHSKEIFPMENVKSQWTTIEQFLNQQQLWDKTDTIDFSAKQCSLHISHVLQRRIEEFKSSGMKPPDLLLNIMSSIYLINAGRCLRRDRNFNKTSFRNYDETLRVFAAFQGHSDFMELLVKFGYLSSIPEDSPHLRKESSRLFFHFK